MKVTLEIQRFNSKKDKEPYIQSYTVPVEENDRVLDALLYITRNEDGSLGFRRSCAHGVCGSDAMRINGKEALACKTLIKDVVEDGNTVIRLEPLRHLDVQTDLMVDQAAFHEKFRSVHPFLIEKDEPGKTEYIQSPEDREKIDEASKCINCGACYSACPILDKNPDFIGPAAIVAAARFVNDSRDKGLEARLDILDTKNGVWPCENKFACTRVCPREIKITKLINQTKRQIEKYRKERGEQTAEEVKS